MSISDIREKDNRYRSSKTVIICLLLSIFAAVVNKVYSYFGHGVSSNAMTWMFLYPLLYGGLFYLMAGVFLPEVNRLQGYRLFYNTYNAGIATVTIGSFLKGIMEIAGTDSKYLKLFYMLGYGMLGAGILIFLVLVINYGKIRNTYKMK